MSGDTICFSGGNIFTGSELLVDHCAVFENSVCTAVVPEQEAPAHARSVALLGATLSQGYCDLQVNGGGGVLFNTKPDVDSLRRIAVAHRKLGTTKFLPTLISDTPERTSAAIKAVAKAVTEEVSAIAGLHLEGPHLSLDKKGAHDASYIRKMQAKDMDELLRAAEILPKLKITIAPENCDIEQVATLAKAGVIVALGHSNANYSTCRAYQDAGALCVTHLFNAMSQLCSREPGLVGACLNNAACTAGFIADGVHVHAETLKLALNTMGGMGRLYLVTDAMAVAGTSLKSFELNQGSIKRQDGKLLLEDGTLAGADIDMTSAIKWLVTEVGVSLQEALIAAISNPRRVLYAGEQRSGLIACSVNDCICINADLSAVQLQSAF